MQKIDPRLLKGFRDYLPNEQIARQAMIEKIRRSFELFGFQPLETPVLEYEDILAGKYGEEGEKLMYRFSDNGERQVAMRYDLTIPLVRVFAQYNSELPKPFKRYQIAPVWRADKPQKGRYREFTQCDADIVGAELGLADAECIALLENSLLSLGIKKFVIKVNNRKILNAVMLVAGLKPEQILEGIRSIDKLEKIGAKAVAEELEQKFQMTKNEAEGLIRLASTKVPDVGALKTFVNKHILRDEQGQHGFDELNTVFAALRELGVSHAEIDLSLARGLDYYTSTVYEAVITETPETRSYGSVAGGGRYDKLVGLFTDKDVSAVGVSLGIDRLISAIAELGIEQQSAPSGVLVINMDQQLEPEYLKILSELRAAGINSELYYKSGDLKKQYAYAEAKGIGWAVIFGEDEKTSDQVVVRDLHSRKQKKLPRRQLAEQLCELL